MVSLPDYAELHCLSSFSFLRGASHPDELVAQAAQQGYAALALSDECSFAGVVRAHQLPGRQQLRRPDHDLTYRPPAASPSRGIGF